MLKNYVNLKWVAWICLASFIATLGAAIYSSPAFSEEVSFNRSCRIFTEGVTEWEAQERKDILRAHENGHIETGSYVIFTYNPKVVDGEPAPEQVVAMSHLVPNDPDKISVVVIVADMDGDQYPDPAVIACYGYRESVPVVEGGQGTLMSLTATQEASD